MRKFVRVLIALMLASSAAGASDEACSKIKGFIVGLHEVDDFYVLPVGISGTPHQFVLELNAAYTKMDEAIASDLHLVTHDVQQGVQVRDDEGAFEKTAIVPTLQLGPIPKKDAGVLIAPHRRWWGAASGVAGINLFYGLDIELDLAHNRLGLYLPREDCEFVPPWPNVEYGNADLKIAPTGGFYLPMYLDDQKLIVTLDTTSRNSVMPFSSAHNLFGVEENDPRLIPAGFNEGGKAVYRFSFKTLSGGHNVTVHAPEIFIVADERACGGVRDQRNWDQPWSSKCFGSGDLRLGTNLLKKLHFFFEIKKKKATFTLVEVPPNP